MSYPAPTKITMPSPQELALTWADGTYCVLPLKLLRDECPCAGCKGETILGKVYLPMKLPTFTPGMNEVAAIEQVGKYAVQITWKDGHNTGIYTWELLHLLCAQVARAAASGEERQP